MALDTFFRTQLVTESPQRLNDLATWSLTPVHYFSGKRVVEIVDSKLIEQQPLHVRYREESWKKTVVMIALFIPGLIVGIVARSLSLLTSEEVRNSFALKIQKSPPPRDDSRSPPPSSPRRPSDAEVDDGSSSSFDDPSELVGRNGEELDDQTDPQPSVVRSPSPYNDPSELLAGANDNRENLPPTPYTQVKLNLMAQGRRVRELLDEHSTQIQPRTPPSSPGPLTSPSSHYNPVNSPLRSVFYGETLVQTARVLSTRIREEVQRTRVLQGRPEGSDAMAQVVKKIDMSSYYRSLALNPAPSSTATLSAAEASLAKKKSTLILVNASLFFIDIIELEGDKKRVQQFIEETITAPDYPGYFYESFLMRHPVKDFVPMAFLDGFDAWNDVYTDVATKLTKLGLESYLLEGLDQFRKEE